MPPCQAVLFQEVPLSEGRKDLDIKENFLSSKIVE